MSEDTEDCKCEGSFVKNSVLFRLKQESTWRGIITIATLVGWRLAPGQSEAIIAAGVSFVSIINILKRD